MELQKLKTTYCELKEAQCLLNGNSLNIAHIVVGDGNGTIPTLSKDMTSLVNQRLQLNITVDDSSAPKYKFIADIPNDAEEFAIRELGITDSDNKLLYVAQMNGTNTNIIKQGISKQLRLQMLFTPADGVNIVVVDPSVVTASTDFCNENFQKLSQKSQPSGYASLDTTGKVPKSELPDFYHPPLLSYFWSEHKLNDVALLLANTFSWQSGATYSNAYNKLVEEYDNESSTTETSGSITYKLTPNGFKIADATQEQAILDLYNSTGSAKIYILDKENTRFKLPRWKHKTIKDSETMPVKGNGLCLGLTNGSGTAGLYHYQAGQAYVNVDTNRYGTSVGGSVSDNNGSLYGGLGVTSDSTKSGLVAEINNVETDDMYLYFYVGEYTQSAIEQTAGLNAELFNTKADLTTPSIQAPYLKTSYINGSSGYNIWSNGYCEQWGRSTSAKGEKTVILLKNYSSTNYNILIQPYYNISSHGDVGLININTKTSNSFTFEDYYAYGSDWRTSGYLAEGEY